MKWHRRDALDQACVEWLRNDVVHTKRQIQTGVSGLHFGGHFQLSQVCDFAHTGNLHRVGDFGCAAIQSATEDVREAQHVVHLVGVVRAACGNDAIRAHSLGQLGANFWLGVGQGQDEWLVSHGLDHVLCQHAGG